MLATLLAVISPDLTASMVFIIMSSDHILSFFDLFDEGNVADSIDDLLVYHNSRTESILCLFFPAIASYTPQQIIGYCFVGKDDFLFSKSELLGDI